MENSQLLQGDKCETCGINVACGIEEGKRICVGCVEKLRNLNYGCFPCQRLGNGECKGAKPGSFYYPTDCSSFDSGEEGLEGGDGFLYDEFDEQENW